MKLAKDTGPFAGVNHTAWTHTEGAPGSISSLAQSTDGYLWVGSSLGLYRFDGVQFAEYPFNSEQPLLATKDVTSLAADAQGGLWIGLRTAVVVHLGRDGRSRNRR